MKRKQNLRVRTRDLSPDLEKLYKAGESLQKDIEKHLDLCAKAASKKKSTYVLSFLAEQLRDRAHGWFNEITVNVLPQTTFDRAYTNILLRRLRCSHQHYDLS